MFFDIFVCLLCLINVTILYLTNGPIWRIAVTLLIGFFFAWSADVKLDEYAERKNNKDK